MLVWEYAVHLQEGTETKESETLWLDPPFSSHRPQTRLQTILSVSTYKHWLGVERGRN